MTIAVSPNTLKSSLLSCVLKALMCESIKPWIWAGGWLVAVVFGCACAANAGTANVRPAMEIAVRRVGFDIDRASLC